MLKSLQPLPMACIKLWPSGEVEPENHAHTVVGGPLQHAARIFPSMAPFHVPLPGLSLMLQITGLERGGAGGEDLLASLQQ
jgi:hypothetical protein